MFGSGRSQGFSLLEVLVAFAILAVSLGVVLQVISTGLRSLAVTEEYARAALLAESKLAAIGIELPLEEGVEEGELDDQYRWTTRVQLSETEAEDEVVAELPVVPYDVSVEVNWQSAVGERSFALRTMRLGPRQP